MSDWDLYKENIQPRRRGHTAAELANLSKLSDPEFVAQRQVEAAEWEAKWLGIDTFCVNLYDYF